MGNTTKVTTIVMDGMQFKAAPYVGGASVQAEERYRNRRTNIVRGVMDLHAIATLILRRLDIEAAEKGQDAQFLCAAYRDELREALRGCAGKDPRKTQGLAALEFETIPPARIA